MSETVSRAAIQFERLSVEPSGHLSGGVAPQRLWSALFTRWLRGFFIIIFKSVSALVAEFRMKILFPFFPLSLLQAC